MLRSAADMDTHMPFSNHLDLWDYRRRVSDHYGSVRGRGVGESAWAGWRQARDELFVLIAENGVAAADDGRRIEYVQRALRGVRDSLNDGVDVLGYTYWSALDNFEWVFGYRPTFGLIAVDRFTQQRTVKPSGRWLGEVARYNGSRGIELP